MIPEDDYDPNDPDGTLPTDHEELMRLAQSRLKPLPEAKVLHCSTPNGDSFIKASDRLAPRIPSELLFHDEVLNGTTTNMATTTLTAADVKAAIEKVRHLLEQPEPFREFMLTHGCDPAKGWVMIVPSNVMSDIALPLPLYVRTSKIVTDSVYFVHMPWSEL